MNNPENFNLLYSRLILSLLTKYGITNFILSPGLRNAPLMNALKYLENIDVKVSIDERAAAYMAIGQFNATGIPSVLICTSGTAIANYYPALLEAQKSNIPMVIISADRPQELHFESSNQTMDQLNIFKTLKDSTLNLPVQDKGMYLQSCYTQVERYIQSALGGEVIHLNFPFREPLDISPEMMSKNMISEFKHLLEKSPTQIAKRGMTNIEIDSELFKEKNGLLVIGELNTFLSEEEKKNIIQFIGTCPWPKVIDVTTSLKYHFPLESSNFPSFDHPEVYKAFEANPPDLILHLGGKLTSKKYHEFIYKHDMPIIKVSQDKNSEKALSRVNHVFSIEPHDFVVNCLQKEIRFTLKENSYLSAISNQINPIVHKKIELIEESELTFPKISKYIVENIIPESDLYIGNSTAIRSFDSYASLQKRTDLNILSHRGVSGIEGFLAGSSAFHDCKKNTKPTVLVIGDVSFLHDLNSLNLIKASDQPFIIVLINNFGGGIFTLVNFKDDHGVMPWMTTPHEIQFNKVCETFGLKHQFITHFDDFDKSFKLAQSQSGPQILELKVDNNKNLDIYQKLKTVRL